MLEIVLGSVFRLHKTLFAENRLATLFHWTWLEGDLTLGIALCTNGIMHFTVSLIVLAGLSAVLTALWCA